MGYQGRKFSVLGDSISTFHGITTSDPNTFYGPGMCRKGGLGDVGDTWWMRVIHGAGGQLERVNAFSGSCVADGYGLGRGFCTPERTGALGRPEVILIFGGGNDQGFGVPENVFRRSYTLMLSRLREAYPGAEIFCGTLINGRKVLEDEPFFMGADQAAPLEPFSSIIRECAADAGAHVADLAASGLLYDAIDGCHPTARGMEQLAGLWLAALSPVKEGGGGTV